MNPHAPPSDREPAFSGIFSRAFLLFLALALLVTWLLRDVLREPLLDPDAEPRTVTPRGDLAGDEQATIELFEIASRSVCHIETSRGRSIFGEIPEGSGSGFLWDEEGHVVTNDHVVRDADAATVRLANGRSYAARLVGRAPDFDLAVLEIAATPRDAPPLALGTSADLRVGQKVFAIGNPFGLDRTLTTGVISGLNRSIGSQGVLPIHGVIQTDAAINPGNSGGPLLDSAGRLIGVNTAITSPSGAYAGVGFAVPVDTVNRIVPRILREGYVQRAILGIRVGPDLWARDQGIEGAVVDEVYARTAAHAAGLRGTREVAGRMMLGDVILALDEEEIRSQDDLFLGLERYREGDRVQVLVSRPRLVRRRAADGREVVEEQRETVRVEVRL